MAEPVVYQQLADGNGVLVTRRLVRAWRKGDIVAERTLENAPQGKPVDLLRNLEIPALLPDVDWVVGVRRQIKLDVHWLMGGPDMWVAKLQDEFGEAALASVGTRAHPVFEQEDLPVDIPMFSPGIGYEVEIHDRVAHGDLQMLRSVALQLVQAAHAMRDRQPLPSDDFVLEADNIFSASYLGWSLNVPLLSGRGTYLQLS